MKLEPESAHNKATHGSCIQQLSWGCHWFQALVRAKLGYVTYSLGATLHFAQDFCEHAINVTGVGKVPEIRHLLKGHFTHETESPWPVHSKHSHWWKRRSRSKVASHYAGGINGVCECKMDVNSTWIPTYMASNGSCFMVNCIIFKKPLVGGRPNTKPGDHGTPNAHNRWFILFHHVWRPAWIYRNSLKYHLVEGPGTYGFTLHSRIRDLTTWFEGVLGRPLDAFFRALTISWSWLLVRVWSGPKYTKDDI
jgi:hypothetical protein